MQLLLQACISESSITNIKKQLEEIEKASGAIRIKIDIDEGLFESIENINKIITRSFQNIKPEIDMSNVESSLQSLTYHYKDGEKAASSMTRVTVEGIKKITETVGSLNKKDIKFDFEKGRKETEKAVEGLRKLEEITKNILNLDLTKLGNKYKNLINPNDINNVRVMIDFLKFDDPDLGHKIDLIKLKIKELSATYSEVAKTKKDYDKLYWHI